MTDRRETDLPDLKLDPRFGYFPWWPEDGDAWIHPEDVALARQSIPSPRIWRREDLSDTSDLVVLQYGEIRLRVRPRLWQETPAPEFQLGELVEVRSRGMQNDPVTGHVREITWDDHAPGIRYQIESAGRLVETKYTADDLKPVDPTQPEVVPRIEPTADSSSVDRMVEGLEVDEHRRPNG